jgi:hypothetical protein
MLTRFGDKIVSDFVEMGAILTVWEQANAISKMNKQAVLLICFFLYLIIISKSYNRFFCSKNTGNQ